MSKRFLIVSGFVVGALAHTATALAQSDANPAKPNVLLLVDTSGSMEWKSSNVGCPNDKPCYPTCKPDQPNDGVNNPNEKSRWTELLEVMTGSVQKYSCFGQKRSGALYKQEFQLGTFDPPDIGNRDPYHRSLSDMCAPSPGVFPSLSNPYEFPTGGSPIGPTTQAARASR